MSRKSSWKAAHASATASLIVGPLVPISSVAISFLSFGISLEILEERPSVACSVSLRVFLTKLLTSSSTLAAFWAGSAKRSSNFARAHSIQWSIKCGKLRSVHMGTPPPSSAAPPSAYERVKCGTTMSTFAPVPIVPDSRSGFS
jgi:hypothetical protein